MKSQNQLSASSRLWRCLVILSPLPLTIIVLGLNAFNYYCFDWNDSNQSSILDGLQFVAKIHDLLIAASVTAIVLHSVLYHLTMKDDLSLAAITPAYQLSQTKFIFKPAFWVDMFHHGRISLGILIIVAVFLINIANPVASIAVIPKPGWWPVPPKVLWGGIGYNTIGPFYISNTTSIWPDEVSTSYLPINQTDGDCLSSWGVIGESCPAAGYLSVAESLSNDYFQTSGLWNVLISNLDTSRSLTSLGPIYFDGDFRNRWSISSSISQIMATSFSNYNPDDTYYQKLGYQSARLLKPLVQVECAVGEIASSKIAFPHEYIPFPGVIDETWELDTGLGWDSAGVGPSLLAAFNINNTDNTFNYTDSNGISHTGNNQTAFTCSVDARWAPVKMWMYAGNDLDYRIHEDTPYNLAGSVDFLLNSNQILDLQQIQIDPAWAASLNVPASDSTKALTMEQIIRISHDMNSDGWSNDTTDGFLNLVAAGMGMMITDGLARLSWFDQLVGVVSNNNGYYLQNWGYNSSLDTTLLDLNINSNWLKLDFAAYREGWSYSLSGVTIKLALAILLLHLALAVTHTVIVVFSRDPWTTKSWKSIGELLVLAINSDQSEKVQNTCARIDSSVTWRKQLKIREIEQGHLGLVVDDHGDMGGFEHRSMPKAVPGRRYGRIRTNED